MKKSLFALAAVGAIAGTAQAQSSVTVYGILDVGYAGVNTRIANAPTTSAPGYAGGVVNSTSSAFSQGGESTNRLGFKGNEDLGGGLSAFFTIESEITPNAGTLFNGTTSTTGNRQTFAGLKKNGIGQFALGTQYTLVHNAAAATDPGQLNNMMGNVIYDKGTGAYPAFAQTGSNAGAAWTYSGMQNNTSYTVRANNMLTLQSDTFAGFQGNAMIVLNNKNTNSTSVGAGSSGYTAATGTTNSTAWGLGVNYTWQKLMVTANYQNFTDKSGYTVNNTTGVYSAGAPTMNGYSGGAGGGVNDKDNQQYYAATYDFGILKAFVQYVNRKTMDVNNSTNYVARTAQQIGVRSFVTPTVEAWASTGTGKLTTSNAGGASGTNGTNTFVGQQSTIGSNSANFGGFQLGSNYWLSKRTNLYAIYGQEHTSNQNYTLNANPISYNSNNYAVGLRHTF
ncbi:porin [Polynucleobacter paneuropaeus]|nr:porin [Polynucleobacter paneuropaeus]